MATVTKARRSTYLPTPEEIAAACDGIHRQRLAQFDVDQPIDRAERARIRTRKWRAERRAAAANRQLQQSDETEPVDIDHRDPRQTEQWIPVPTVETEDDSPALNASRITRTVLGKVPVPAGGPVEMSAADRCGFDVGSLNALNSNLDEIAQEDRWRPDPLAWDEEALSALLDDLNRPIGVVR